MVLRPGREPTPQLIYTFIETEKANHRVSVISHTCATLLLSKGVHAKFCRSYLGT